MEGWTAVELLLESWLLSAPFSWTFGHAILDLIEKEELEPEEILRTTHAAASLADRDSSVFWLLSRGAESWTTQPDSVGSIAVPAEFASASAEIQCFVRALLQGKGLLAFTLVRHAWTTETWSILKRCAEVKGIHKEAKRLMERLELLESCVWEARATALLLVANSYMVSSRKHATPLRYEISPEIQVKLDEWKALEGRRARREFRIRTEALGPSCARASQRNTESNLQELREPLAALKGCPYWETVAEDMGGWKAIRKSDDHKEAFYDLYFPDDIPDEWSAADQEKSHGRGILIGSLTDKTLHSKCLRNLYLGSPSNGLEVFTKKALAFEREPQSWKEMYESEENRAAWGEALKTWRFEPMKKKILLIK